jgi:hypothetical protein
VDSIVLNVKHLLTGQPISRNVKPVADCASVLGLVIHVPLMWAAVQLNVKIAHTFFRIKVVLMSIAKRGKKEAVLCVNKETFVPNVQSL